MRRRLALLPATALATALLAAALLAGRGKVRHPAAAPGGATEAARAPGPPPADAPRPRIEVLNAAGRPGLARQVTERLRAAGFDVVYFGNAPPADSSAVLDRVGDDALARRIAAALGIRRVLSRPDSGLYLEASVVLGKDWEPPARPPGRGGRWWARLKDRWSRR